MPLYFGKPIDDMVEDYYNYDPYYYEIDGDYDDDSSDLPPLSPLEDGEYPNA